PKQRVLGGKLALRAGDDVVRAVRNRPRAERIIRRAELDEVDLGHLGIRVAPLSADERGARGGLEIDDRARPPRRERGRGGRTGRECQRFGGRHRYASTFTTK